MKNQSIQAVCAGTLLVAVFLSVVEPRSVVAVSPVEPPSAEQIFAERIMPIFNSPKPSSCVQCHLASVDLKDYIKPSAEDTFRSLLKHGMVDLDAPNNSKILTLIAMGELDEDRSAQLLHQKTRELELSAFASWIQACCADERFTSMPVNSDVDVSSMHPTVPNSIIRHARKDRLLDSFSRNVWSQRMRCFPCHTPSEIDSNNPMHEKPAERYRDYVAQYGAKMNIFQETPLKTMKTLLAAAKNHHGDGLPLINLDDPKNSLLVLKPTAKLPGKGPDGKLVAPSSVLPVSHVGGLKMHVDDFSYKAFVSWIDDCANTLHGNYASEDQLPSDNWYPSQFVVRVMDTPDAWPKMSVIQVFAYPVTDGSVAAQPVAFTQTKIAPRGNAVGTLFMLGAAADEPPKLLDGEYVLRVFLDDKGILAQQPTALLNDSPQTWQTRLDVTWAAGFKEALTVDGGRFEKVQIANDK